MNENLTEIIFVLDRSGSMSGLERDTIGGYNAFLKKQKIEGISTLVTTVLFDDKYELLYNGVSLEHAKLSENEYYVRGSTALLDAVGKTILDVGNRLANTAEYERPSKVFFVITTDGMENASREFKYQKVNELITHQTEKYGWEFIFLGANIDSKKEARMLNIKEDDAVDYCASPKGVNAMWNIVNEKISTKRKK